MDEINVQVKFATTLEDGSIYRDALWFTEAEWEAVIPEQLEAMKKARVDNYVATVAAASLVDTQAPEAPEEGE